MSRKIHTRSKIFFKNPRVVRVQYETDYTTASVDFLKLTRKTYRAIQGTWGHSNLDLEILSTDYTNPNSTMAITDAYKQRGYFCFKDEIDLLQFRLCLDVPAIEVSMWPERLFTIHEVIEET